MINKILLLLLMMMMRQSRKMMIKGKPAAMDSRWWNVSQFRTILTTDTSIIPHTIFSWQNNHQPKPSSTPSIFLHPSSLNALIGHQPQLTPSCLRPQATFAIFGTSVITAFPLSPPCCHFSVSSSRWAPITILFPPLPGAGPTTWPILLEVLSTTKLNGALANPKPAINVSFVSMGYFWTSFLFYYLHLYFSLVPFYFLTFLLFLSILHFISLFCFCVFVFLFFSFFASYGSCIGFYLPYVVFLFFISFLLHYSFLLSQTFIIFSVIFSLILFLIFLLLIDCKF